MLHVGGVCGLGAVWVIDVTPFGQRKEARLTGQRDWRCPIWRQPDKPRAGQIAGITGTTIPSETQMSCALCRLDLPRGGSVWTRRLRRWTPHLAVKILFRNVIQRAKLMEDAIVCGTGQQFVRRRAGQFPANRVGRGVTFASRRG